MSDMEDFLCDCPFKIDLTQDQVVIPIYFAKLFEATDTFLGDEIASAKIHGSGRNSYVLLSAVRSFGRRGYQTSERIRECLIQQYCALFWLDTWYHEDIPWTPHTTEYALHPTASEHTEIQREEWDGRRFIRLNSCSPKDLPAGQSPIANDLTQARQCIRNSQRCQDMLKLCHEFNLPEPRILARHVVDIAHEFRLFVYHGKLTAISWNDAAKTPSHLSDASLTSMAATLVQSMSETLDHLHYVVDAAIPVPNDHALASRDEVWSSGMIALEINPWGSWARTGGGAYSWVEDSAILHGFNKEVNVRVHRD